MRNERTERDWVIDSNNFLSNWSHTRLLIKSNRYMQPLWIKKRVNWIDEERRRREFVSNWVCQWCSFFGIIFLRFWRGCTWLWYLSFFVMLLAFGHIALEKIEPITKWDTCNYNNTWRETVVSNNSRCWIDNSWRCWWIWLTYFRVSLSVNLLVS